MDDLAALEVGEGGKGFRQAGPAPNALEQPALFHGAQVAPDRVLRDLQQLAQLLHPDRGLQLHLLQDDLRPFVEEHCPPPPLKFALCSP